MRSHFILAIVSLGFLGGNQALDTLRYSYVARSTLRLRGGGNALISKNTMINANAAILGVQVIS